MPEIEPIVISKPNPFIFRYLKFLVIGGSLITAVLAGVIIGLFLDRSILRKNYVNPNKLPISLNTLDNKVITHLNGVVEGTLTKKDKNSFTIANNGSQLLILVHPNLTGFVGEATPSSHVLPQYSLDKLPLGSQLSGTVSIRRNGIDGSSSPGGYITGNTFTVKSLGK